MASLQGVSTNTANSGSSSGASRLLNSSKALATAAGSDSLSSSSASASTGSSASTSSSSSTTSTLDYDDFLTLFCTQLQYQDPTNPMESYELASQLAQFSTVEQLTEANTNLLGIESYLASLNNTEMVNLIGKEVVGNAGGILVKDGTVTNPSYTLPTSDSSTTYSVTVKIYDSDDTLIQTLSLANQAAGSHSVDWDGLDSSGASVSDGQYYCTITAEDSNGSSSTITGTNTGTVYSFVLDSTSPYVVLDSADGLQVPVSNVYEITTSDDEAEAA